MNIFSSFNFGKIIKIILPGFFTCAGLLLLIDACWKLIFEEDKIIKVIIENKTLSMFYSIPIILAIGMTCNTIFFVSISTKWFENWFINTNPEIAKLKSDVFESIKVSYVNRLTFNYDIKNLLIKYGNAAGFIHKNIDLEHFYFLQESYWAYFEYHANMLVASVFCFVGSWLWVYAQKILVGISRYYSISIILLYIISWSLFIWLSVKAAKLNYYKFQIKQLSYFSSIQEPAESEKSGA